MMSSATSIDKVLPPEGGRSKGGSSKNEGSKKEPRGFRLQSEDSSDPGFRVWHFFVLLSFIAATVAVLMAKQSTPEYLILISLAVGAAGVAAYACYRMLAPLARADTSQGAEPVGVRLRADLDREKNHVLRSIKELEFDRAMGKVSAKDFDEMSGRLRSRAIGIMKQLEGGYREIIERDLAARLKSQALPQPSAQPQPVAPAGLCACGAQNDQDARFCKACGTRLEAA
jgi:hypothetical protein